MKTPSTLLSTRLGCSGGVILFSLLIALVLVKTKPETKTEAPREQVLAVKLLEAAPESLTVYIESQGLVKSLRRVQITPQVGGRVIEMPLPLKAGDLLQKGQLLVKIDPVDYQTALAEAKTSVARIEAGLEMIKINQEANAAQLQVAERSRDLAQKDFERAKKLSEEGQAVSISVVESSERAFIQAETQVLQLQQALAQVPSRVLEAESELAAALSRVEQAALALARTEISAPFDARIIESNVEMDEVLQPGVSIFELADDASLEIEVPVTAPDLRNWIPFEQDRDINSGWFAPLQPVPVKITWAESAEELSWEGRLDRIIRFDATTRTATLAVRIDGEKLRTHESGLPLTAGMFCQVEIPGKTLEEVIALPRSSVTFDNMAYLSVDGRLKTVQVKVARSQGDKVYVSEGIAPGDQVVVTRLVAPLEGVKLMEAAE
jgi:membrane fusion protein, multidrug efflux system